MLKVRNFKIRVQKEGLISTTSFWLARFGIFLTSHLLKAKILTNDRTYWFYQLTHCHPHGVSCQNAYYFDSLAQIQRNLRNSRFQIYTFGACNTLGQIQTGYTRQAGTSKWVSSMICTSLENPCTGLDIATIVLRIFRNYFILCLQIISSWLCALRVAFRFHVFLDL